MSEDACQIGGRGRQRKQFIGDDDAAGQGQRIGAHQPAAARRNSSSSLPCATWACAARASNPSDGLSLSGQFAVAKGQPVQRLQHGRADVGFDRVGHEADAASPSQGTVQRRPTKKARVASNTSASSGARMRSRRCSSPAECLGAPASAPSLSGFEDGAIGQGGAAGGGADAAGPAQCAGRKRGRGAVVQQQRAVGLRRQRGGTMGGGAAEQPAPQRATLRTGGVAKAFKLAEFAAEASGRLVLARYQSPSRARPARSGSAPDTVSAHARPG